jgi:LAO/AO transport system kinase
MGGLSRATAGAVKLLDAFVKDYILLETVGVGQDEVDIARMADSTLLVAVPGLGDEIQALKAGIMEIGDIYVVNKADRDGADRLVIELSLMRDLACRADSWTPPILKTVAARHEGVSGLTLKILEHRNFLENGGGLSRKRNERIKEEIIVLIEHEISRCIHGMLQKGLVFDEIVRRVATRSLDPYSFAQSVSAPFAGYCESHKMTVSVVPSTADV